MANSPRKKRQLVNTAVEAADMASTYCVALLVALLLFCSSRGGGVGASASARSFSEHRPCDEIYVVGEGETLHTISDRCGDPFIVERNPHIHDPDDVFPGLVIKIVPSVPNRKLKWGRT